MLGLSLGKFLVLAILIAIVWYGFKYIGRIEEVRQAARRRGPRGQSGRRPTLEAEDMVKCTVCGAYVAARGAGNCGRPDCPWGR